MSNENLDELMKDSELCEALGDIICEEIESDDELSRKRGFYLIKAFRDGSVDDALIAICGWSLKTLLEKAEKRKRNIS